MLFGAQTVRRRLEYSRLLAIYFITGSTHHERTAVDIAHVYTGIRYETDWLFRFGPSLLIIGYAASSSNA